jgi:glyoxylase-like metal-dependent hydrolase (beta-lactamase superfamily II)
MIEQILDDLYRIEIPLPKNPLKALNSYLFKTSDRFFMVDTGMNREECRSVMFDALRKLNVDLGKTDIFITHLHADHEGLIGHLATETSKVYTTELEAYIINEGWKRKERWLQVDTFIMSQGFPEDELHKAVGNHPARLYSSVDPIPFTIVKQGDVLNIGDYAFTCIETPGHSPCHLCLYEPDKKIFISGDHILGDITPNITYWPELDLSLKHYLASLEKVYPLDVDLVLPGHRSIWHNHQPRIRELIQHHQDRLNEAVAALETGEKTAYEIAQRITWDISFRSWDQFPPAQKWFAVGETIAHLDYLVDAKRIQKRIQDHQIRYTLN